MLPSFLSTESHKCTDGRNNEKNDISPCLLVEFLVLMVLLPV